MHAIQLMVSLLGSMNKNRHPFIVIACIKILLITVYLRHTELENIRIVSNTIKWPCRLRRLRVLLSFVERAPRCSIVPDLIEKWSQFCGKFSFQLFTHCGQRSIFNAMAVLLLLFDNNVIISGCTVHPRHPNQFRNYYRRRFLS